MRTKLAINVRPVKIAYFLDAEDGDALARIIRLCCTQWGGIRHIIIPLGAGRAISPFYKALLKLHEPDMFVSYLPVGYPIESTSQELQAALADIYPHRRLLSVLSGSEFERHDSTAHILGMFDPEDLRPPTVEPPTTWITPAFSGLRRVQIIDNKLDDERAEGWLQSLLYGEVDQDQRTAFESVFYFFEFHLSLGSERFWNDQLSIWPLASPANQSSPGSSVNVLHGRSYLLSPPPGVRQPLAPLRMPAG